jgi:hypothetical protein
MRNLGLIMISVVLFSCSKGKETTQSRTITTPFNTIQAFDKVFVYYKQDTTTSNILVSIEAYSGLMSSISTQVVDSVLQIRYNNSFNYDSVKVYVTAPHVTYFIQDGVGNIYSESTITENFIDYNVRNSGNMYLNLNVNTLMGHVFGIGDAHLSGVAQAHYVNVKGESFLYAKDLNVQAYCFLYYNATGEAHVHVKGQLDVSIEYTGNVYYSGNPAVINKQLGSSGKLIQEQ